MKNKILVVDDTRDIRENLSDTLMMEGYDVITATNGIEALAQLDKELPDLIITDLVMPSMDGFELINEVRKHPKLKEIPILVFSAKPNDADGKNMTNFGADLFLLKPTGTEIILEAILKLIKK